MRHTVLPLKMRSENLMCFKGLGMFFEWALAERWREPTAYCDKNRSHWHWRQNCSVAALPPHPRILCLNFPAPFQSLSTTALQTPNLRGSLLPQGTSGVPRPRPHRDSQRARAAAGQAPTLASARPAPPVLRRPLGRHTLARTRSPPAPPYSGRRRHPAPGAAAGEPRPAVCRPAPAPLAAPNCAAAPRDSWRGDGRGGPAPTTNGLSLSASGVVGRAWPGGPGGQGTSPTLLWDGDMGAQQNWGGLLPGAGDRARNRAPPSSSPVATPPSHSRTWGTVGTGGFTPWTSASALPSLSLSSSQLHPPRTPPRPGLKTSPVSVRLSPQPPSSKDSAARRFAAAWARDTAGTERAV